MSHPTMRSRRDGGGGSRPAIDDAVERIYDAALDPAGWLGAIRSVARGLDSVAACVFIKESATHRVPHFVGFGLGDSIGEYCDHYAAIDPRARYAAMHPQTRIHYDHMLIDERGMDRSEFYDFQARTTDGLRYFLGCALPLGDGYTGYTAFHWHRRQGHVQPRQIRTFTRLVPHITRALQVSHRLGEATLRASAADAVLAGLDRALFLVDGEGRVLFASRMAEAIISAHDGLAVVDRCLIAGQADDHATLRKLIAAAALRTTDAGGVLAVRRPSGRRPYAALVSPFSPRPMSLGDRMPMVVVLVNDLDVRPELPTATLARLFRLTPAEANLAVRLMRGMTVKQAAGDLGIAASTARIHLQHVMNKTGAHRQSELIRLSLTAFPVGLWSGR